MTRLSSLIRPAPLLVAALAVSPLPLSGMFSTAQAADMPQTTTQATTQLDFNVTGTAHAAPTELTIRLSVRADSPSAATAQKDVNTRMAAALKLAGGQAGIEAKAGGYSIYENTPEHAPKSWTAQQELELSGKDSVQLLALAGQLQSQSLMLEGMDWSLDDATREQLLKDARTAALKQVRDQAEQSAQTLGLHLVRLSEIRISSQEPGPRPVMLMAARMADSAPPQRSPDEQTVRVNVFVKAELSQ
ncbi:SIMPL domain-containing protein [Gluconobacter sp. Dm-74]|uniref:SIMPL domain-containing protein n=1 Tax=unclassified Gluconobacter TaxID=2644261 RepID=UPI001B8CAE62|nr:MULTISPECIES: SIMPL domain-containing protein [unclassified Gluconobacter]MBS1074187.1 SIMPL domain-containing protein [Gluconobacter sp. Dm-73]MBS1091333.1 SIMPL domain-containing protein [Gluconobacter sp. Dm-74]